jgi:hypothetical protein
MLPPPPPVLLILGTDAAGKDYVADFLIRRWHAAGYAVEKRAGRFSAAAVDDRSSSERKGRWGRFQEQAFLWLFPLLRPFLLNVAQGLLAWDIRRFRPSGPPVVVVSHTALRLLALLQGQSIRPLPLSRAIRETLRALREVTQASVIILNVDPAIRQRRIAARIQSGQVDPFDRYMVADRARAERIESALIRFAVNDLKAQVIKNNDLDAIALEAELTQAMRPECSLSPTDRVKGL